MTRLGRAFQKARQENRAALVCYVTAGDPSLKDTVELVQALADFGADIVEIGIPFSDPVADGPTIQASAERGLAAGATVERVLECVEKIRKHSEVPLVAMTYTNPVHHYGFDRFAAEATSAGLDGVIITDMPPEEAKHWVQLSRDAGLDTIFLAAPTSTTERLRMAARFSTGFLYCVSRLGVTGTRRELPPELEDLVARARQVARRPICVGFGISNADHVRAVARLADGVVVGSAIVSAIAEGRSLHERLSRLRELVPPLAEATRREG